MKLLVTGARGFLGSTIAEAAARRGWEICGIGRSAQAPADWPGRYCWADVAQSDLTPILDGFAPDIVFHGAGSASVGQSFDTPIDDLRGSVLAFACLLDSVRRSSTRPVVIFPSSAAVYGNPVRLPISEKDRTEPISPYGFHKLQCEILAREYAECFGLKIILCRLFSLFGPRQKRLLVWELFQQFLGEDQVVRLQGTGGETRDFLPADDAVDAMLEVAMLQLNLNGATPEIVNIASGIETSVLDIAGAIGRILGSHKAIQTGKATKTGDPIRWQADVTRLKSTLSVPLGSPLEDGLARFSLVLTKMNIDKTAVA